MGIDYGFGKTNIDKENGIRYGVIFGNSVLQAWADSSEPVYPCEDCESWDRKNLECTDLGFGCDPIGFTFNEEGYILEDAFDKTEIFVIKSPFYTFGDFCSPCAPGAIDLNNLEDDDINKAYCLGHDWFDEGKAPYRVFSVETGKEVFPN